MTTLSCLHCAATDAELNRIAEENHQLRVDITNERSTVNLYKTELSEHSDEICRLLDVDKSLRAERDAMKAELTAAREVLGLATHITSRMIEERDFTAPEKNHRLACELLDALREYQGRTK